VTFIARLANRSRDLLFAPPLDDFWLRQRRGTVQCLLYHRVDAPGRHEFLDVYGAPPIRPQALAAELQFLKDRGARFMTLAQLRLGEFPAPPEYGVVISFDDGFRDNYTNGLDVLDSLGIPAVIFQSTALVGAPTLIWEHALYWFLHNPQTATAFAELAHARLPDARSLGGAGLLQHLRRAVRPSVLEAMLGEMADRFDCNATFAALAAELYPAESDLHRAVASHHELGSHGHHHYMRHALDSASFEQELRVSIAELRRLSGLAPKAFSYPFNDYTPEDAQMCARYFDQVATVDAKSITRDHDPLALPRFTWPGVGDSGLRRRRWLLTGRI
jgi:peptidoglycan/xylan/chitin deacetylase (PgdA/CDA1 family)